MNRYQSFIAIVLLALLAASPVRAGLGGAAGADASLHGVTAVTPSRLSPSPRTSATGTYQVDTYLFPGGAQVREYAAGGTTFGVAWSGPVTPDLRALLDGYYDRWQAAQAAQAAAGHVNLHHSAVQDGDLTVVMGGHMGYVVGRAYVAGLTPSGVDPAKTVK